jgi:hypothetical protein
MAITVEICGEFPALPGADQRGDVDVGNGWNIVGTRKCRVTALAVMLLATVCAVTDAQAGLIHGWNDGHHVDADATPAWRVANVGTVDGAGASSSPQSPKSCDLEQVSLVQLWKGVAETALQETNEGASAPSSGSSGSEPSSGTPMMLALRSGNRPVSRAYRHWRECSPRLPEPLCCELLDPPKVCA